MSDSTSDPLSFPFASESNDKRPLPEIVAERCGFALAYVDHDDGKRYYAVQDWIVGVAQSAEPRVFWAKMKKRFQKATIELLPSCQQFPYRSSSGRTYQMDYAQAEALYQITQRMDAQTGIRDKVLQYLARAGVIFDEVRIDPDKAIDAALAAYRRQGKTDKWIETRLRSKFIRTEFTSAFRKSMRELPQKRHYALITDEMRLGVWKRTTATLREQMGLKKPDSLRDNQSGIALAYETLAEEISAFELNQKEDLSFDQAKGVVRINSESVGKHAEETSQRLGIDVATNRPLLRDGHADKSAE